MKRLLNVTQLLLLTLVLFGCISSENDAVIHLNGNEVITLEVGNDFTDPGAICTGQNEECTVIVSDSNIDTNTVGTYHIKYQGILSEKIVAEIKRTINVVDTTGPSIELNGEESMDVELGNLYEELGASCIDNYDSTCEIEIEGVVNADEVGSYNVSYRAVDTSGNTNEVIRTVIVDDTKAPIITLIGNTIIDLSLGETYIEQGAECLDNDLACSVQITGEVNNTVVGIYTIRYEFSDAIGNVGFAERKISIKDETAPVIKLNGNSSVSVTVGNSYTEQGATCTDNYDESCSLEITGDVDTTTIGEYRLVYKATDSSGNSTETERTVTVKRKSSSSSSGGGSSTPRDTTPPTFYNVPENIIVGYSTVVDLLSLGITANDNRDGDVTSRIIVDVIDTSELDLGMHTVTFTVSDNKNNTTTSLTEIDVVDTTSPVITIIGSGVIEIEAGSGYIDSGATCIDNYDTTCTVTTVNPVDNDTVGTYTVTYNVTDTEGNVATEVTRTVIVVDTTAPTFEEIVDQTIEVHSSDIDWISYIVNETDNSDSLFTKTETDNVNYSVFGTYTVTVRLTDGSGNYTDKTFNVVVVEDTTLPVITITGSGVITLEVGEAYVELGATVTDNYDSEVTVITSGVVDNDTVGTYYIYYNAQDASGNNAIEQVRKINVVDTTPPTFDEMQTLGYGYYDITLDEAKENHRLLYMHLYDLSVQFENSTENYTLSNNEYVYDLIDLSEYSLTSDEAFSVIKLFKLDHPEFFWISNSFSYTDTHIYVYLVPEYSSYQNRLEVFNGLETMYSETDLLIVDSMSDMEKTLAIHDYIITRADYAYEIDGFTPQDDYWAHNVDGFVLDKGVVCEGYAEIFDLLAKRYELFSISVVGDSNEQRHQWNLVAIDDDYYFVDTTWNDKGNDDISYLFFGLGYETLLETHTYDHPTDTGWNYLYQLPTVTQEDVDIVWLYESDQYVGTYTSTESAFEDMTNLTGEYVVTFSEYEAINFGIATAQLREIEIPSGVYPLVGSITFRGKKTEYGEGLYDVTSLYATGGITLNSTLILENVDIYSRETNMYNFDIDDHTVVFEGYATLISGNIMMTGTDNSKIVTKSYSGVELHCDIDVDVIDSHRPLRLRGQSLTVNEVNYLGDGSTKLNLHSLRPDFIANIGTINVDANVTAMFDIDSHEGFVLNINNIYDFTNEKNVKKMFVGVKDINNIPEINIFGDVGCGLEYYFQSDTTIKSVSLNGQSISYQSYKMNLGEHLDKPLLYAPNLELSDFSVRIGVNNISELYTKDEVGYFYRSVDTIEVIEEGVLVKVVHLDENPTFDYVTTASIHAIGGYALDAIPNLTSITITENVTTLNDYALYGVENLIVVVPDTVTYVGRLGLFVRNGVIIFETDELDSSWAYEMNQQVTHFFGGVRLGFADGYSYLETTNNTAIILGFDDTIDGVNVVLPSHLDGLPVVSFATTLFYENYTVQSITLPETLLEIPYSAFYFASNLKTIHIGENSNLVSIGDSALHMTQLTSLYIPEHFHDFGSIPYDWIHSLEEFVVHPDNPYYTVDENGVLFDKDKTELIKFPVSNVLQAYEIPASVIEVGNHAFEYNNLTEITFAEESQITTIGYAAFSYSEYITSIEIQATVSSIADAAFHSSGESILERYVVHPDNPFYSSDEFGVLFNKDKTILKSVPAGFTETSYAVPNTVVTIKENSFNQVDNLVEIIIPNSVVTIEGRAFYGLDNLTTFTIESGSQLQEIGYAAFNNSRKLQSIVIPISVHTIGWNAFSGCYDLLIYAEAISKPSGWHDSWNSSDVPVEWGYETN
ncbi:DUF5011 domain-containing protein [Mycoplasmatota bacterium zrk1]